MCYTIDVLLYFVQTYDIVITNRIFEVMPKKKPATKSTQGAPKRASAETAKKVSRSNKVSQRTPSVKVKSNQDVLRGIERVLEYNLHDRFNYTLPKRTKNQLVAYGPWLATLYVVVISPQLLNLAKNGTLLSVSGFFNNVFFNQQAWVVLVIMLLNVLFLVDGLSDLFNKKRRGWTKVYITALITAAYVLWQLFEHLGDPAAPILGILIAGATLFTLYDIRDYYK